MMDRKQIGRIGLSSAIHYFTVKGDTISLPINDTQWYDLIVEKNGKFQTVQCKATNSKDNSIDFRSTGGTRGKSYDSILNHNLDLLFCVDGKNNMFLIPLSDLRKAKNQRCIALRTEVSKLANKDSFDTSRYLVHI